MPFKRDLFTGELVETEACEHGREIIFRGETPFGEGGRAVGAYNRPWVSEAMGLENPDQYREFNDAMKRDGVTGAHYRPDGKLECASRGARNRALKWLGKFDRDAGYGDYSGR